MIRKTAVPALGLHQVKAAQGRRRHENKNLELVNEEPGLFW
jgi:hypothetical protein